MIGNCRNCVGVIGLNQGKNNKIWTKTQKVKNKINLTKKFWISYFMLTNKKLN